MYMTHVGGPEIAVCPSCARSRPSTVPEGVDSGVDPPEDAITVELAMFILSSMEALGPDLN